MRFEPQSSKLYQGNQLLCHKLILRKLQTMCERAHQHVHTYMYETMHAFMYVYICMIHAHMKINSIQVIKQLNQFELSLTPTFLGVSTNYINNASDVSCLESLIDTYIISNFYKKHQEAKKIAYLV